MKQKVLVVLVLVLLLALLAGLNAATYVQKEKVPDSEFNPHRSTYNAGSTGIQAYYSLLAETGRKVTRWQTSLETIASETKNRPSVLFLIGPLRRELSETESTQLMQWVSEGGTLILIDREPSKDLVMSTSQWQMKVRPEVNPEQFTTDASDPKQMTADTPAQKGIQPTFFTKGINGVQPSRFASSITLERSDAINEPTDGTTGYAPGSYKGPETRAAPQSEPYDLKAEPTPSVTPYEFRLFYQIPPPPPPAKATPGEGVGYGVGEDVDEADEDERPSFEAPLIHIGDAKRNLLVEAPFGSGRVVVLSDPYIVSNGGIPLADNAQLGINLATSREGIVAFDEYHHGYGSNNNRFFQYFEGTPVIAIFLQCSLLVGLFLISQSRRFARPVPEPESNRLSKLEYVAAMAELQQRTRAYDLAVENIYADFRRRASAVVGVDNTTASRRELAARISERIGDDPRDIEDLLFKCEDVIHGEPVDGKRTIELIEGIRRLEDRLGLHRSAKKGL
jgi:hypothetical protein